MVSWLSEVPKDELVLESPTEPRAGSGPIGTAVVTRRAWESIGAYETSVPTAPSPGRIYRRTWLPPKGSDEQPRHWLFLVVDAPDGDGQLHIPHEAIVVDDSTVASGETQGEK